MLSEIILFLTLAHPNSSSAEFIPLDNGVVTNFGCPETLSKIKILKERFDYLSPLTRNNKALLKLLRWCEFDLSRRSGEQLGPAQGLTAAEPAVCQNKKAVT